METEINKVSYIDAGETIELFVLPHLIDTVKNILDEYHILKSFGQWIDESYLYRMIITTKPGFLSKKEVIDIIEDVNIKLSNLR